MLPKFLDLCNIILKGQLAKKLLMLVNKRGGRFKLPK